VIRGVTGLAQVNYPYGASVEDAIEKLQYDLFYIQNMSLLLEIRIFLKTIQVVLSCLPLGRAGRSAKAAANPI
jgi:lipopolysaccharide/colanic/teichoic acid biosynthesis glycosyltransferase